MFTVEDFGVFFLKIEGVLFYAKAFRFSCTDCTAYDNMIQDNLLGSNSHACKMLVTSCPALAFTSTSMRACIVWPSGNLQIHPRKIKNANRICNIDVF